MQGQNVTMQQFGIRSVQQPKIPTIQLSIIGGVSSENGTTLAYCWAPLPPPYTLPDACPPGYCWPGSQPPSRSVEIVPGGASAVSLAVISVKQPVQSSVREGELVNATTC
ncbi:unnamed protein product [Phytophthora fragariaefolia]|uniref:Unnamed protein product n=1 Tax=Phytophthora fragariaefolia TaxID=1490495 RepID=A0A9W6Y9U6_9STRA|nr:unnamed protein product [Phytophthora fragariaefolia]